MATPSTGIVYSTNKNGVTKDYGPNTGITRTPSRPTSGTVTSNIYNQAVAQAKAALAAEQAPLQQQQAASDAYYSQRAQDATNIAAAVSNMLKGIAPDVQGVYNSAAQNESLLGHGFSAGMADALNKNAAGLNSLLASVNAPAQIDAKSGETGDALAGIYGLIPADSFVKQGAAAAGYAAQLPGFALEKGLATSAQAQAAGASAHTDFDSKIADLAAKLPGDIQTNYEKLQQLALDNKKFGLEVAKYKTSVGEFNARQALSVQKLRVQEQQFAQRQANTDRNYQLSLQRLGISKKSLALRIAAQQAKLDNGGLSPAAVSKYTSEANGIALAAKGQKASYDQALAKMLQKGIPASIAEKALEANDMPQPVDSIAPISQTLRNAYNQTVGVTLGTSPNGTQITWSAPPSMPQKVKAKVSSILSLAQEYLGTPYAWGGESPTGFDCSGLAQYLYGKVGISIPRTTYDQFQAGLQVPRNQLQPGDLVFFKGSDSQNGLPGHVGIYVGGGKMVDAPHTGDVVKVESISSFPDYMGARRYVH